MPVVEQVAEDLQGKVDFLYVSLDKDLSMARKYKIMGVPVLMRIEGGQQVRRIDGLAPESTVRELARVAD